MKRIPKDLKTDDLPLPDLGLLEVSLIQIIFYALLWLWSDYVATLVTIVLVSIFAFLLSFALIAELIDRSRVPRRYFYVMALSIVLPILTAIVFVLLLQADFSWTREI